MEMRNHNVEGGALEIKAIARSSKYESMSEGNEVGTQSAYSTEVKGTINLWHSNRHYDWLERISG